MKKNIFVNMLINLCLASVIVITFFACNGVNTIETLTAFKSYNGVIYAGNEDTNKVGIMINVYWGTEYLEDMLSSLDKYNAKATFFVGGSWVEENPDILIDITHVDNVVESLICAMKADNACLGQKYNITNDESIYMYDFLKKLMEMLKIPFRTKKISYKTAILIATILEFISKTFLRLSSLKSKFSIPFKLAL